MAAHKIIYGRRWKDDVDPLEVEMEMIRQGGYFTNKSGQRSGLGLVEHFKRMFKLCWPDDDHHRWSDLMIEQIIANRITAIMGARDCVAGNTKIPNPITGETPTIQELCESGKTTCVDTLNGPAMTSVPFVKGYGPLFEVVLSSGDRFTCAANHFVLTPQGYVAVKLLSPGRAISSASPAFYGSTLESCLSTRAASGLSSSRKVEDSMDHYCCDLDLCDAQLPLATGSVSKPFPLQADVPSSTQDNCYEGVLVNELKHNPLPSQFFPLSNGNYAFLPDYAFDSEYLLSERMFSHVGRLSQSAWLLPSSSGSHRQAIQSRVLGFGNKFQFLNACEETKASVIVVQSINHVGSGYFYDLTVPYFHHYKAAGAIHHNSSKTRTVSKWALCDYWCHPHDTLILMTSTDSRSLELRVWGDIKSLVDKARERYPWLPGNVVDAKHGLFTDDISGKEEVRDMRKGIIAIPCLSTQGEYLGLALKNFAGIKQKRRRLVGDELQFLPQDYLKVLDSLDKGDFKAALLGNPIADNGKALDKVTEPKCGWTGLGEVTKTMVWDNKYNGVTINLVGTDSPNFDAETLNRYPYLVDQSDVDRVSKRPGGKDSIEWWSQIMGVRKAGAVSNRVLTVAEIDQYGGFGDNIWLGSATTKVYAIDAGFGGDPCVRTWAEFGKNVADQDVLVFGDQKVIPILVGSKFTAEEQIANYAKLDCATLGIPFSNVFFDAGMYATLAVQMARTLSNEVNAVNFGGTATTRPVDNETYVSAYGFEATPTRRLKTCYEHYSKFVTELWFSVRLLTQCRQARKWPRAAAEEFGRRLWDYVSNDRYELETKDDYKLRNGGESPNCADSLAIAVEGARRLGFEIKSLLVNSESKDEPDWLALEYEKYRRNVKKTELQYK